METSKKQKVDRHEMPCQPADVRRRNFKEVALGYDEATALAEAGRCLQCKKPLCVSGCPVNVPIRDFIGADSLHYLSVEALSQAAGGRELCTACFDGRYPSDLYDQGEA